MNLPLSQANLVVRLSLILLRNILSGLFLLSLVIRFLIKDGIAEFAVVYYSTPLPILAIFSVMLGLMWWLSNDLRIAKLCFGITLGCLLVWSGQNISFNSRNPEADDVRLFFWNAASNKQAGEITGYIQNFDADIIGMVEAGIQKRRIGMWENVFPEHVVQRLPGNMALVTKGKILSKISGPLGKRGHYNLVKVDFTGKHFYVLLVDIDGDPLRSRAPAFQQLTEMIHAYAQTNLIVMGDFNTPIDSVHFKSFRQNLTHAFESGGFGFSPTWPVPLPVLTIDHIWVSKNIKVTSCNLNWSRFSDHRPVVASIAPPDGALGENCSRCL